MNTVWEDAALGEPAVGRPEADVNRIRWTDLVVLDSCHHDSG